MGVFLGPLGGLREVGEVQAGVQVSASRPSSERVTLDGRRIIQRAPRASRSWALSLGSWRDPSVAAYMSSCASGVFPGPLYLLTAHAAATNMLPANVAAPGAMGSHGLLTSAGMFPAVGTVPVNVAGQGVAPSVGVVQSATAGAWSKTIPVRQVPLVLSAWASAAGAAIEWRTVNAAGGVAQSGGTVSAAAVVGGFRGEVAITPSATAVGVQVRVAAGSRVVGGLRLVEGSVSALSKWTRALESAALVQAISFGDSITEGAGASALLNRWQTLTQDRIRTALGVTAGAASPFVPAYSTTNVPHPAVRRYGTVTEYDSAGFGGRTAVIGVDGEVRFTFTGTSCKLMYHKASGTGVMRMTLDGGSPIVINTNSVSNPPGKIPTLWESGPLARGVHVLSVKRDATSATGQHPYVEGLLTFDEDEVAGIRFIDASRGATDTTYLSTMRTERMAASLVAAGGASLATIAYGTNDYSRSIAPADFRANIERQIAAIRAVGFDGSVLLINMYKGMDRSGAQWAAYGQQMAAIAASDPDVAYLDLRDYMPDVPTPYDAPAGQGFFADGLHPSDAGHSRIAEVVSGALVEGAGPSTLTNRAVTPVPASSAGPGPFAAATLGWGTGGAGVVSYPIAFYGPSGAVRSSRMEWTTAPTAVGTAADIMQAIPANRVAVRPGIPETFSVLVRSSRAQNLSLSTQWLTDTGGGAGNDRAPSVNLVPGMWKRLTITATPPSTASTVRLDIDTGGSPVLWRGGDYLDATQAMFGPSEVYFDGSTNPDAAAFLVRWTGPAYASPSTMQPIPEVSASELWHPGQGVPMVVVRDPSQTMQFALPGNHRSDYAVTIEEVG